MNKPKGFPLKKLVIVEWSDACTVDSWASKEEYLDHTPSPCLSAGFLLSNKKDYVTIVTTQSLFGGINQAIAIPKPWVVSIKPFNSLFNPNSAPAHGKKSTTPALKPGKSEKGKQ